MALTAPTQEHLQRNIARWRDTDRIPANPFDHRRLEPGSQYSLAGPALTAHQVVSALYAQQSGANNPFEMPVQAVSATQRLQEIISRVADEDRFR